MQSLKPQLRIHEPIALFTLPSSQGGEGKLWDYKMLRNLVILYSIPMRANVPFVKERLKMFAENHEELVKLETEI